VKADKSAELLEQVRQQMGDGKFSRAFATLKDLLASNPSHQEGRRLLARLLLKFGNLATAKNAFETLVKEALQRQDYQEAESLLHEYLTAGPRCVQFLEMLGAAYELKGDPLAAVFEYEKAIDILLEDPDPERPDYSQVLFQKIKQLAPSSFVANRVAARLQPPPSAQPPTSTSSEASTSGDDLFHSRAEASFDVHQEGTVETVDRDEDDDAVAYTMVAGSDDPDADVNVNTEPIARRSTGALGENVPFPPVNQRPDSQIQTHEEGDNEASEPSGFGAVPVCEPSHVRFYSEESEEAASESQTQTPAPVSSEPVGLSRSEPPPTFRVENDTKQDLYWTRVMDGGHSGSADQGLSSLGGGAERGGKDSERPKPRRQYGRTIGAWISFRLSILIRRLIATTNSLTKLGMFVCLAIVAWIVLIIGGTAALWLGLEQKPSETFQRLIDVAPTKTLEDWKNNGYILLMGFGATPSLDPMQTGYDRWLSAATEWNAGCLDRSAKSRSLVRSSPNAQKPADWFKTPDPSAQFVAEGAQVKETLDPQGSSVSRYRQWLNLPFEDWGFSRLSSPDCEQILAAHRLYLAEGFAQSLGAGLDRLETDLTAWRKVLAQAKTLSTKVMAIDGINDDVAVMSGLLIRPAIDNKITQRMIRLARPLDPEERSLRWPMQNEFALSVKRMEVRVRPHSDTDSSMAVLVGKMPLPKQRTLNTYALYYDALIKAAGLSHAYTPKLYEFSNTPARSWLDYGLNPIDNLIVADPVQDWQALNGAIVETDARLRLAGLQARFRAPSSDSLISRLAQAGPSFFDPFTELPMLVNGTRGTLYSVGMDRKDDGGDPTFDVSVPFLQ